MSSPHSPGTAAGRAPSHFRVFYSWISDEHQDGNRMHVHRALTEALHRAADRLEVSPAQAEVVQCARFDAPTDIAGYILTTIPTCHALVGDISFINAPGEERTRRTPNPNTMFEVGLAMQCLGRERVILVFNTDSGNASHLPFDIRNHALLTFSGGEPPARLARALKGPVEAVFRDYLTLVRGLAREVARCSEPLLRFLEDFMRRHIEDQHPGFTAESMAMFRQEPEAEGLLPQREFVARVLHEYQRRFLDAPSAVTGFTEGNLFAVVLQRLHHDCERLAYRFRGLGGSDLFRHTERVGAEAGHLERLIDRVGNRVPDPVANEIVVNEILDFLRGIVEAGREVARWAAALVTAEG
jgi:hypothetical protein